MKNSSTGTAIISVIAVFCLAWFLWIFFAYAAEQQQSNFDKEVTADKIQALLTDKGLKVCDTSTPELKNTPGLENARQVSMSTDCDADTDPMRVSLLKFDSEASRNAALQRASSAFRNGIGPHSVYAYGAYVITVQGSRTVADQALLDQALQNEGA